ncbi:MAG TPA: hypothetical protein VGU20_08960 [Stellaceae bacterium]|nr:hypothetical protein [Stellaceae bacterium]
MSSTIAKGRHFRGRTTLTWVNAGRSKGKQYQLMTRRSTTLTWALRGAALAAVLSLLTLVLPPELGGYNAWNDPHLVIHNLAAILTRIAMFALLGAALYGVWHQKHRLKR